MKAKLFAMASLLAIFASATAVFQQYGYAADTSVPVATSVDTAAIPTSTQSASFSPSVQSSPASDPITPTPRIEFLRPLTNEMFSNTPFYIQVSVDGFKLVAPGQSAQTQGSGYIRYTLDDFPVVCTKATQIMVNKNLGHGYIPSGKHYLKAELVDCSDHPLNPPVIAESQFASVHPAYVEETRAGAGASPTPEDELLKVQRELDEVLQHLLKLESGDTGYEPRPMLPTTTTIGPTVPTPNVKSKVTQ